MKIKSLANLSLNSSLRPPISELVIDLVGVHDFHTVLTVAWA
jgi:glycogen synthase